MSPHYLFCIAGKLIMKSQQASVNDTTDSVGLFAFPFIHKNNFFPLVKLQRIEKFNSLISTINISGKLKYYLITSWLILEI